MRLLEYKGLEIIVTSSQSENAMNHMSLVQHLKTLKAAIPIRQKEPQHTYQFPIYRHLKDIRRSKEISNQGIFSNLSFCIPMLDPSHDPSNEEVTTIVKGIFMQGGKIIEFNEHMSGQFSKLVIVSQLSEIDNLRDKLKGLIQYEMMVSYKFVEMSLKSLKRMKIQDYLLFDNTDNLSKETAEIEEAKKKLLEEKVSDRMIRPKFTPKDPAFEKVISDSYQSQKERKECNSVQSNLREKNIEEMSYQQFSHKGIDEIQEDYQDLQNIANQPEKQTEINQDKPEGLIFDKEPEKVMTLEQNEHKEKQAGIENYEKETKKQNEKKQEKDKYHRNSQHKLREAEEQKLKGKKKPTDQYQEADIHCPWEPKGDRKRFWYIPPKNLASHSFQSNIYICNKLSQLQQIYRRNRDTRNFLYLKVITIIKSHNKEIKCAEDLEEVEGLSKGMKQKIKEILKTGQLSRLNRQTVKEENNVCQELQKVWGIGSTKAKELYDMGIKTVEDLKNRPDLITKNVSVGLKYFDQFAKRIPRDKVTRIFQQFKKIFYKQVLSDKSHQLEVVGSYRRGKATCGDIDILICRQDGSVEPKLLQNLVAGLEEQGFITDSLSHPRIYDGRNSSAYMGVCFFEGQHHRIDIKQYPVEQYAFALMYFTGSDIFNRQMRMVAHNKGLMLSDHGIKKKQRNGKTKIWTGGEIPILKTQEEIFKFFGQEYCTPAEREI